MNVINRSLIGTAFCLIGYCFQRESGRPKFVHNKTKILLITMMLFFAGAIYRLQFDVTDIRISHIENQISFYLVAVIGCVFTVLLCSYFLNNARFIQYCGKNSLIIMTTHGILPIIGILLKILWKIDPDINFYILVSVTFICVIVIEIVLIEIINRYAKFLIKFPKRSRRAQEVRPAKGE